MSAPPPAPLTLVPFPSPDCTSASVARDLGGFPSVHTPPNDSLSGPFHPLHLLPDYEEDLIRAVDGWPTLGMLDFIEYQLHDAAATDRPPRPPRPVPRRALPPRVRLGAAVAVAAALPWACDALHTPATGVVDA